MQTLSIDASTQEIAQGLRACLRDFSPEVRRKAEGGYQVVVSLRGNDAEIVALLSALQRHVTEQGDGAARVDLAGRSYTLHPEPV